MIHLYKLQVIQLFDPGMELIMRNWHISPQEKPRNPKQVLGILAFAGALACVPNLAQAHPHVWIEARSQLVLNDQGKVSAIKIDWQFDEYYTASAIQGLDTNKDGKYEPKELHALAAENIEALKDYDYFTRIKVNGKKVKSAAVKTFRSEHKKGLLHLIFTLPLKTPVDVKQTTLTYLMYDPSFYISVLPTVKTPVTLPQTLLKNCRYVVKKSQAETEGDDDVEKLIKRMASPDGMGLQYAQPIIISCKRKTAAK